MPELFQAGQEIFLEIETKDSTLSSHTNRKIWYVLPTSDGKPGDVATAISLAGTAIAGLNGNSVNQGTSITLTAGPLRYWSESDNPAGGHCESPAFEIIVDPRGFVRR